MVTCIVCKKTDKSTPKRSFHAVPSDQKLREKWIQYATLLLKDPNLVIDASSKVCSSHFKANEIIKKKTKWVLIEGAVPSVGIETEEPSSVEDWMEDMSLGSVTESSSNNYHLQVDSVLQEKVDSDFKNVGFFASSNIKSNVVHLNFYTGFKDSRVFDALYKFFNNAVFQLPNITHVEEELTPDPSSVATKRGRKPKLSGEDQFLMTMMRLRLNLPEKLLGDIFGLNQSNVSRTTNKWILVMSKMLKLTDIWPSKEDILKRMPAKFKNYPDLRVILDCTEVEIEHPSSTGPQRGTWSTYKNRNTVKGLVGITPYRQVAFVSKLYGGRMSDKKIVNDSKILDLCQPGDQIMADRGFLIQDECKKKDIGLILPAFMQNQQQFSGDDIRKSREIAKLRAVVETIIGNVKHFKILRKIPLTLAPIAEDVWMVCNYLSNFTSSPRNPTLDESEDVIPVINGLMVNDDTVQLKDVRCPDTLISKFLELSKANTEANVETLGILIAIETAMEIVVCDLIIPPQTGTSFSCTCQDDSVFSSFLDVGKIVIGWIHTHPQHTCFMSSLDLDTQHQYQKDKQEFFAIVCSDTEKKNDVFRVTDPYGLNYLYGCNIRDTLHHHENVEDLLYQRAQGVVFNSQLHLEVHDLR